MKAHPHAIFAPVTITNPVAAAMAREQRAAAIKALELERRMEAGYPVRPEHLDTGMTGLNGLGDPLEDWLFGGSGGSGDSGGSQTITFPWETGGTSGSSGSGSGGSDPYVQWDANAPWSGGSGGSGSGGSNKPGFGTWIENLIGGVVKAGTTIAIAQGTQLQPGTYQVRLPNGAMTTYVQPVGNTTNLPIGSVAASIGVGGPGAGGIPTWALLGGALLVGVMLLGNRR